MILHHFVDDRYRSPVFYSKDVGKWCVPFLGADKAIVYRSMRHNFEQKKERTVRQNAWPLLLLFKREVQVYGICLKALSNLDCLSSWMFDSKFLNTCCDNAKRVVTHVA